MSLCPRRQELEGPLEKGGPSASQAESTRRSEFTPTDRPVQEGSRASGDYTDLPTIAHVEFYETFAAMNLRDDLLRGISAYGIKNPSVVQQQAIIPIVMGRDTLVKCPAGLGKTITYIIAILQNIDVSLREVQALILAPIREMVPGLQTIVSSLGKYMGVVCDFSNGKEVVDKDYRAFQNGAPQVVVGTPRRLIGLLQRRALQSNSIKIVCVDETDEMLSRGFKDQIMQVMPYLSPMCQLCFFTPTTPPEVLEMSSRLMRNSVHIVAQEEGLTLDGVRQFYIAVEKEDWTGAYI